MDTCDAVEELPEGRFCAAIVDCSPYSAAADSVLESLRSASVPLYGVTDVYRGAVAGSLMDELCGLSAHAEKPIREADLVRWLREALGDAYPDFGTDTPTDSIAVVAVDVLQAGDDIDCPAALDPRLVPNAGSLHKHHFSAILSSLGHRRATGVLVVTRGEVRKEMYVDGGLLVGVRSSKPAERLGELLVRHGWLTSARRDQVVAAAATAARLVGEQVIAENIMTSDDLLSFLYAQQQEKLAELFAWVDGEFTFTAGAIPASFHNQPLLAPVDLLWQGIRFSVPVDLVDAHVTPFGYRAPVWHHEAPTWESLALQPEEAAFLRKFKDGRPAATIGSSFGDSEETRKLVFLLITAGFVTFAPAAA